MPNPWPRQTGPAPTSQTPTTINYIGRPDSVYVYGTMNRTIGFNLKVVALNEGDIETIWEKVNYLKELHKDLEV